MNKIKSFSCHETQLIYDGIFSKKLPSNIQKVALRKMIMLDNASSLNDLRNPPGNRFEALHGELVGWYSIRINDQYRLCFREKDNFYYDVKIMDYH